MQLLEPIGAHQHLQRRGRRALGRGHVLAQLRRRRADRPPAAPPRRSPSARASCIACVRLKPLPHRRHRQRLDQIEHIGRPRPRHRRHRIEPAPRRRTRSPAPAALSSASATARSPSLILSPTAPVMPLPICAGVFGMVRTTRSVASPCAIVRNRNARRDREHQRVRPDRRAPPRPSPASITCGLTASTSTCVRTPIGSDRAAGCRARAQTPSSPRAACGSTSTRSVGGSPPAIQPRASASPILPAPDQDDRADILIELKLPRPSRTSPG